MVNSFSAIQYVQGSPLLLGYCKLSTFTAITVITVNCMHLILAAILGHKQYTVRTRDMVCPVKYFPQS